MARIESDPNYTAPTFSRADAATDLFKKEDVQNLAAAMSVHTHNGSGKGLAIAPAAGSIAGSVLADGSITSAKILDATIQTIDIGARQVTEAMVAIGSTGNPATTSAVPVQSPEMTIGWTGIAGEQFIAVYVCTGAVTGAGATGLQNLNHNGADAPMVAYQRTEQVQGTITVIFASNSAAGANTVKAQCWVTGGGTYQLTATYRMLFVVRFLR